MKTSAIVLPLALVGSLALAPSAFARDRHVNLDFHIGFPVVVSPYYAGHPGHGHHGHHGHYSHHHGHHGHYGHGGHHGHGGHGGGYQGGHGYYNGGGDDDDVHYHNGYACRLKHTSIRKGKHD